MVLKDPKVIKLVLNETRAQILFQFLTKRAMTVKQLSEALDKNPGSILHHINKLKEAGLVELVKSRVAPTGIVEKYYRAVARRFTYQLGVMFKGPKSIADFATKHITAIVNALEIFGIKIKENYKQEFIEDLIRVRDYEISIAEKIDINDNVNVPDNIRADAFELAYNLILFQDEKYLKLKRKLLDYVVF